MKRKIGWGLTVVYNFFRLMVIWLFNCGKIKYSLIEIVSPNAKLASSDKGTIKLGKKCGIESGTLLRASGGKIVVGNRVYINRNCTIVSKESINIGEGTTIGPNVTIYDHDHSFGKNKGNLYKTAPIFIGKDVWIGTGAIILKGISIGEGSVIGAGAVITRDIPANTIATNKNEIVLRKIN